MTSTNGRELRQHPLIAITMGDPAGIGPEIIAKGWQQLAAEDDCRFFVIGCASCLRQVISNMNLQLTVTEIDPEADSWSADPACIPCATCDVPEASHVTPGQIDRAAGHAAYQAINTAITMTQDGTADAIVTCPIHKAAIRLAGYEFPGHTEILAQCVG